LLLISNPDLVNVLPEVLFLQKALFLSQEQNAAPTNKNIMPPADAIPWIGQTPKNFQRLLLD